MQRLIPSLTGTIGALPATLQFDGLSVVLIRTPGNFATGDSFLLQPTKNGASDIGIAIERVGSGDRTGVANTNQLEY